MNLAVIIILGWIASIIISLAMDLSLVFQICKDIADAGYKVDFEKINKVNEEMSANSQKHNNLLSFLTPGYNIYHMMKLSVSYVQFRDMVLNQFDVQGTVEKMSEYEVKEYNKKPTGLNAFLVTIKSQLALNDAIKLKLQDPEGCIWYISDQETHEIVILKTDGMISNLTLEEQKELVNKKNLEIAHAILDNYGNFEEFFNKLKFSDNNSEIILNKTRSEKIEELKKLKEDYTESKEPETKENSYQKTNKKQ